MRPNIDRTRKSNSSSGRNSVFYALQERMRNLSFLPFQMCVLLWLGKKGFHSIQPLGRIHRRGRRVHGGADFTARLPGSEIEVAIQVRHWRSPLQRRAVDELWGFMLRHGVPAGLVICSSGVMAAAEKASGKFPGRPIELVSCATLCSSMVALELGVREQQGRWGVDEAFFRSAHELAFARAMSVVFSEDSATGRMAKALHAVRTRIGAIANNQPPEVRVPAFVLCAILVLLVLMLGYWFGGRR